MLRCCVTILQMNDAATTPFPQLSVSHCWCTYHVTRRDCLGILITKLWQTITWQIQVINMVTILGVILNKVWKGNCDQVHFNFVLSMLTTFSCFGFTLLLRIIGGSSEIMSQIAHCRHTLCVYVENSSVTQISSYCYGYWFVAPACVIIDLADSINVWFILSATPFCSGE